MEIVDGKKYNNSLSMNITNVNIPTSKTTLCNSRKQSIKITDIIKKYIKNHIVDGIGKQRKVLIVTYKSLCNRFSSDFNYVGYFGNLKGFNDYKDIYKMAHIGMNRYSPMAYFYIYCGCHMDKYKELSKMSKKKSLEYLTNLVQKQECQEFLNDVMIRCILADFEQNIFRLAIRNYGNEDNVHIWAFYNIDGGIYVSAKYSCGFTDPQVSPIIVVDRYLDYFTTIMEDRLWQVLAKPVFRWRNRSGLSMTAARAA